MARNERRVSAKPASPDCFKCSIAYHEMRHNLSLNADGLKQIYSRYSSPVIPVRVGTAPYQETFYVGSPARLRSLPSMLTLH